jgi:HK97 gp10 family phage protein
MIESNVGENMKKHEMAKQIAVLQICELIEGAAVLLCPVDKGDLRASIGHACKLGSTAGVKKPANYDGIVATNKEHALYVEFGTRPHVITVKTARVLSDGKETFGTRAQHPGTQAQPFMRPAVDRNIAKADRIMKNELGKVEK